MEKPNSNSEESGQKKELKNPGSEEIGTGGIHMPSRRRKRIKVRKRIRVKKRSSSKKKARKTMETIGWILLIAAFLLTFIILIFQLDIKDRREKKSMGKDVSMIETNKIAVSGFTD